MSPIPQKARRATSGAIQPLFLAVGAVVLAGAVFAAGFAAGRGGSSGAGGSAFGGGNGAASGKDLKGGGGTRLISGGSGGLQVTSQASNQLGAKAVLSGTSGWQAGFGASDAAERFLLGAAAGMDVGLMEEELKRFASAKDIPALLGLLDGKDRGAPGVNDLYDVVFTVWAREDPEAALQWMHQQTDRGLIESAARAIAGTYARRDFAGAVDWLRRLPDNMGGRDRERVINSIFSEGAKTQPLVALREAQKLEVMGQRRAALNSLMENWAEIDFSTAWRHAGDISEAGIRGDVQEEMLERVARQGEDGRKAIMALLDDLPTTKLYNRAIREIADSMNNDDPEAAMKWAESLPSDGGRGWMIDHLQGRWARSNPEDALKDISGMPAGRDRDRMLTNAFNSLSWRDPLSALERASALGSEDDQRRVIPRIVSNIANMDPTTAADYVNSLPDGRLRADAASALMDQWTQDDPGAASEWLMEQPAGQSRDRAIETMVNRIRHDDAEAAVAWAATVTDEGQRMRLLERSLHHWKRRDPGAATSWVQSSPYPDDFKQKFLN